MNSGSKLEEMALQEIAELLDEARTMLSTVKYDVAESCRTGTPSNQITDNLGRAAQWVQAIQDSKP